MNTQSEAPVVVGYDGSPAANAALRVGAAFAALHRLPLRIVHAYVWPVLFAPLANLPFQPEDWVVPASTQSMLDGARSRVLAEHAGLSVDTVAVPGSGAPVLLAEAARAAIVIIGRHGVGGVAGTLAGSVATELAAQATCPVMVVGQPADRPHRPRSGTLAPAPAQSVGAG